MAAMRSLTSDHEAFPKWEVLGNNEAHGANQMQLNRYGSAFQGPCDKLLFSLCPEIRRYN